MRKHWDGNEHTNICNQCKNRRYVDSVGSVGNKGNVSYLYWHLRPCFDPSLPAILSCSIILPLHWLSYLLSRFWSVPYRVIYTYTYISLHFTLLPHVSFVTDATHRVYIPSIPTLIAYIYVHFHPSVCSSLVRFVSVSAPKHLSIFFIFHYLRPCIHSHDYQ